jgi:phospholipid/cholesterol/gamma-HCH transport system substrate-binding protein
MARGEQWAETGVGAVVLVAAGVFLAYALGNAGGLKHGGGYDLVAKFGQVGSLAPGADVKVAGVKVGAVSKIVLDPKTFQAETHITVNNGVELPEDSTVKITSDSLLGGQHIAIEPGASLDNMKPGSQFQNVQGAVDLFGLIGQVLRPQSGAANGAPAEGPAASPASPPAAPAKSDPYPAPAGQ